MAKKVIKTKNAYQEATGRFVYKTQESYKGVEWTCKGSSMENITQAKKAWQKNRERRMRQIDGLENKKYGRIKLRVAMTDWYDLYKRYEVKNGRSRSERTILTDEDTMNQIFLVLGDKNVCDIDSDEIQKYLLSLANDGLSQSTIKKRWNMLESLVSSTVWEQL